jgi:hypothetical protein
VFLVAAAVEDMQVSTSPYAAAATGQELVRAVRAVEGLEDTWVTVFGFAQADLPLVIREFSKAGNIQQVKFYFRVAALKLRTGYLTGGSA